MTLVASYIKQQQAIDSSKTLYLFLLYVNDLPNVSNFKTTLFADDANLNMSHSSIQTLQLLVNQEINKVDEWLKNNKLYLELQKK